MVTGLQNASLVISPLYNEHRSTERLISGWVHCIMNTGLQNTSLVISPLYDEYIIFIYKATHFEMSPSTGWQHSDTPIRRFLNRHNSGNSPGSLSVCLSVCLSVSLSLSLSLPPPSLSLQNVELFYIVSIIPEYGSTCKCVRWVVLYNCCVTDCFRLHNSNAAPKQTPNKMPQWHYSM